MGIKKTILFVFFLSGLLLAQNIQSHHLSVIKKRGVASETGEIFADDFEDGDATDDWDAVYISSGNTISIATDTVYAGTYSAKFTSAGNNSNPNFYLTIDVPDATQVYIRYYIHYGNLNDWDGSAWFTTYFLGLWMTGLTSDPAAGLRVMTGASLDFNAINMRAEGTGGGESNTTPTLYTWERHEIFYSEPLGIMTFKIDGDSVLGRSGFSHSWGLIDSIKFGVQMSAALDTGDYFYLDNVRVDTTGWIGE